MPRPRKSLAKLTSVAPVSITPRVLNQRQAADVKRAAADLMDDEYRLSVALHEAAHAEYMERRGATYVELLPPQVLMLHGKPSFADAATRDDVDESEIGVLDYTKEVIAAEIVELFWFGESAGSGYDFDNLETYFTARDIPEDEQGRVVRQASEEILNDLRDLDFQRRLWARARFFDYLLKQAVYKIAA